MKLLPIYLEHTLQFRYPKSTEWSGYEKSFQERLGTVIKTIKSSAQIEVANDKI